MTPEARKAYFDKLRVAYSKEYKLIKFRETLLKELTAEEVCLILIDNLVKQKLRKRDSL